MALSHHSYAVAHPELKDFNDTRSTIILDYHRRIRCSLTMNHVHRQDLTHRASMLKVEGVRGAAVLTMGVPEPDLVAMVAEQLGIPGVDLSRTVLDLEGREAS